MPDDIKPDEELEEQVQPESEDPAVDASGDLPNGTERNNEEAMPEAGGEAVDVAVEEPEESPVVESDAEAESEAANVMEKMFDNDSEAPSDQDPQAIAEDDFPDLSQVKMEETMANPAEFQQLNPLSTPSADASNINLLLDVKMPVSIELGRTEMPISEILTLGPGSVVELDKLAGEPVDLLVNDKIVARGEVVVVDENFGVRITMLMSPEERLKSLAQ
jgi:flagellar motor switch protein FliN/FliY